MLDRSQTGQIYNEPHVPPPHRNRPKTVRASYNTSKLKNPYHLEEYQRLLDEKFPGGSIPSGSTIEKWSAFKDAITAVAKEVLGSKTRMHQDCFDENGESIQAALDPKNKAFTVWQNGPTSVAMKTKFKTLQTRVQSDLREMQDQCSQDKADKVQSYADSHNAKKFFSSLKTVYGLSRSGCSPVLSSDCTTLIKGQVGIRERWAEHFSSLLDRPSTVDPEALNQIPKQPVHQVLDLPPSTDEIKRAILQTNSDKALGKDDIPAELY